MPRASPRSKLHRREQRSPQSVACLIPTLLPLLTSVQIPLCLLLYESPKIRIHFHSLSANIGLIFVAR
jgi:hypothetical protein